MFEKTNNRKILKLAMKMMDEILNAFCMIFTVLFAFGVKPVLSSIKKIGGKNMPVYKDRQLGKYNASVIPSDYKQGLVKRAPFFNGSYVCFDLRLKTNTVKNIKDCVHYEWEFWDKTDNVLIKQGSDIFEFSNIRRELKRKDKGYRYEANKYFMSFTKRHAIRIGDLWELHKYDLLIKETETTTEKEIITEFTLQDICSYGLQFLNSLIAAGFGAIGGGVISFIILLLFGEF